MISPCVQVYTNNNNQTIINSVTSLLNTAAKIDVKMIDRMLESELPLNLALTCLKMTRERGVTWSFSKHQTLIQTGMEHYDEDVRLQVDTGS